MSNEISKITNGFILLKYDDFNVFKDIDIKPSDMFRVIHLSTYLNYDNILTISVPGKSTRLMTRKDMFDIMSLKKSDFIGFKKRMIDCGLLTEDKESKSYHINKKYIVKGKSDKCNNLKIFIVPMRNLYLSCQPREHKVIANIFKLSPLIDKDNLIRMSMKDVCSTLEVGLNNSCKFKNKLESFTIRTNNVDNKLFEYNNKVIKINEGLICKSDYKDKKNRIYEDVYNHVPTKGESKILVYLEDNGIPYEQEMMFEDLIGLGGEFLRYDFYLPTLNVLIEYDGEFHYFDLYKNPPKFKKLKCHDKIKDKYTEDNNIKLIRIPYWDIDNVSEILNNEL